METMNYEALRSAIYVASLKAAMSMKDDLKSLSWFMSTQKSLEQSISEEAA